MELEALTDRECTVDVLLFGVVVTVTYRPFALSLAEAEAMRDRPASLELIAETLLKQVCMWNITELGEQVPITATNIGRLPIDLASAIIEAIQVDKARRKMDSALLIGLVTSERTEGDNGAER